MLFAAAMAFASLELTLPVDNKKESAQLQATLAVRALDSLS
jgi:hypothetical protein